MFQLSKKILPKDAEKKVEELVRETERAKQHQMK